MSKRSVVTMRERPVKRVTTATGPARVHAETFTVTTAQRVELIDLTDRVMALAREAGVREGIMTLASMHTTSAVFVNESQGALLADIQRFLEHLVRQDAAWLHNDPAYSDCDRLNADAHLRALLLGHSVTLPVSGGEVVLGRWQRLLMAELDGPRERTLRLTVIGVA
jgi:secondary thiamine-phosphate synthase enzyme